MKATTLIAVGLHFFWYAITSFCSFVCWV